MTLEIRPITESEAASFIDSMSTAFLDRPDTAAVGAEVAVMWDLTRAWAAFDSARIVGTFRSWATELTVPGLGRVPAAAVTNVTVLPTHRRRGLLTALATAAHAADRERGEVASLLYAAEYPIYGRFGYGPATSTATWTFTSERTKFRRPATGAVTLEAPSEENRDLVRDIYEAWRMAHPGEIRRRVYRWDYDLGLRTEV